MSTYANIKMTTDKKTVELNEIQCGLANTLYTYITERLQQKFQLGKIYQINPVDLCKFINETNDIEIDWDGELGFTENSELYHQSYYFFENHNHEEEMKAFQNNQYLFGHYINENTKLEISFD